MVSLVVSPQSFLSYPKIWNQSFRVICDIAFKIFHEIAMVLQYFFVASILIYRFVPLIPSALPREQLKVRTFNIARLTLLKTCMASVWQPLSKEQFQEVGRLQNLSITRDIIYRPASGLCLGMGLVFLSRILLAKESWIEAAKEFEWGGDKTSVKVQALYDTLIKFKQTNLQQKNRGRDTPINHIDLLHHSIVQAVANFLHLEVAYPLRLDGRINEVSKQLEGMDEGSYLLQFPYHTVVLIKESKKVAIFDPSKGLAIMNKNQQGSTFPQLLGYYGYLEHVSLKVLSVTSKHDE